MKINRNIRCNKTKQESKQYMTSDAKNYDAKYVSL